MIINRQNKAALEDGGSTLPSNLGLKDFAQSIDALDLQSYPPHERLARLKIHTLKMAAMHLKDRQLGTEIGAAYVTNMAKLQRG